MKKRLRFLYRYLLRAGSWRYWVNTQTLLIVVVSGIFLAVLAMALPFSSYDPPHRAGIGAVTSGAASKVLAAHAVQVTEAAPPDSADPLATQTSPTPTRTPFPQEFFDNAGQTGGITLAGVALVLIVLVGFWSLRSPDHERE